MPRATPCPPSDAIAERAIETRRISRIVPTYIYNPLDLLPDDGPLGMVDDTLVCVLGLDVLQRSGKVQLDQFSKAACDLALPLFAVTAHTC